MPNFLSVSEAARRLSARPQDISLLFYRRELRDDVCPIVGGRLTDDGRVLLHCFAGCSFHEVCGALGVHPSTLKPNNGGGHANPRRW